jgi:hypothetical protein
MFPFLQTKETLLSAEELQPFKVKKKAWNQKFCLVFADSMYFYGSYTIDTSTLWLICLRLVLLVIVMCFIFWPCVLLIGSLMTDMIWVSHHTFVMMFSTEREPTPRVCNQQFGFHRNSTI